MGHGGTGETSEGPQQVRMEERGKSTNSKERANGKERGRRAVSSSSEPTGIEESANDVIGGFEKSKKRKRGHPLIEGDTAEGDTAEGDTAEPKPK